MKRLTFRTGMGDDLLDAIAFLNPDDAEGMYNLRDIGKHGSDELLLKIANRLAEYEDMEEQGLLLRLPCKVGATLYHASCAFNRVDEYTVLSISMLLSPSVSRMEINAVNHRGAVLPFDVSDFGKTVFLTREAAEKALEDA